MNHNFPETKFVKEDYTYGQIKHILSEADEVRELFDHHREGSITSEKNAMGIFDEIADLMHSCESLCRMLPKEMEDARQRVIQKNRDRGYYVGPPESLNELPEYYCVCGHPESDHPDVSFAPTPTNNGYHLTECKMCTCKQFINPADPHGTHNESLSDRADRLLGPRQEEQLTDDTHGYDPLAAVLLDALHQAQHGKGRERHAQDLPFVDQPIMVIPKLQDTDKGLTYQAMKKIQESERMEPGAASRERLGAIVYLAASILWLQDNQ